MAKEYIEREALLKTLGYIAVTDDFNGTMLSYARDIAMDIIIKTPPAADVVEVKHGEWFDAYDFMVCSECGAEWNYFDNDTQDFIYCPNCGAKMDGESRGNENL